MTFIEPSVNIVGDPKKKKNIEIDAEDILDVIAQKSK